MALSEEQQKILNRVREKRAKKEKVKAETPTQRGRMFAQGLTFGFADEIEAAIKSLGKREYSDLVKEIRTLNKAYSDANPIKALGYELGGAALPSMIAGLFTGGAGAAAGAGRVLSKYPALAKVAAAYAPTTMKGAIKAGAASGAAYGAGTSEGNIADRAQRAAIGGVTGGAIGGAAQKAMPFLEKAVTKPTDALLRKLGGRNASRVDSEARRIVADGMLEVDEVLEDAAKGRSLATNPNIGEDLRAYRATGGRAATILKDSLDDNTVGRSLRQNVVDEIQDKLSEIKDPNLLKKITMDEDAAKALERKAYSKFDDIDANAAVLEALKKAIKRVPSAKKDIDDLFQAKTGSKAVSFDKETGEIILAEGISVNEVEAVRRTIRDLARSKFDKKKGTVAFFIAEAQDDLKASLDAQSKGLKKTRADAAKLRTSREAFDGGRKAFGKQAADIDIEFNSIASNPDKLKAYRTGFMQAIRDKMTSTSRKSFLENIKNQESKEGQIFKRIFPDQSFDEIEDMLETVSRFNTAQRTIQGGPQTAITQARQARQGADVTMGDIIESVSSPIAFARTTQKVAKQLRPDLTDAEREAVVRIMTTTNRDELLKALADNTMTAQLQDLVERAVRMVRQGAQQGSIAAAAPPLSGIFGNR